MIFVENTPNNLGVTISGDFRDFEQLYYALHKVCEDEEGLRFYTGSRMRVLGMCYEIRHALQGDRGYSYVDNGVDADWKRKMSTLAPDKNLYLQINMLWPEILYITMVLNKLVRLYAMQISKTSYDKDAFTSPKVFWDNSITQIRVLQSAIIECLQQIITPNTFSRTVNTIYDRFDLSNYLSQYIDLINHRFIEMTPEKRLKNISISLKRMVEQGEEYQELLYAVKEAAREAQVSIDNIRLNLEFPDTMDW